MKSLARNATLLALSFGILLPQVARGENAGGGGFAGADAHVAVPGHHAAGGHYAGPGHFVPALHGGHHCHGCANHAEHTHQAYLKSCTAGRAEYTHGWNLYQASQRAWHGKYYNAQWGRPLALVVPPTAANQVSWGWGVGSTTITPIYHQFGRGNPATYPPGAWSRFHPTPYWPTHTDQFGVDYVRGPW